MNVDLGFDREALSEFIERVGDDAAVGQTVWTATTHWRHGFRSEAVIRSHTIAMDEPTHLGGTDTAPNMVEVVLGAYGCCLTTGFVAQAGLLGIDLERVDIQLSGDLDLRVFFGLLPPEEVSPGYTEVRALITLTAPGAAEEELRRLHSAVVATSPVGSIISRPVRVVTQLECA
ncbi:OsmC family protein [Geodermatophilus sp. SYSU D01186]